MCKFDIGRVVRLLYPNEIVQIDQMNVILKKVKDLWNKSNQIQIFVDEKLVMPGGAPTLPVRNIFDQIKNLAIDL